MLSKSISNLLEQAGIYINGHENWDIQVHDGRLYRRVFLEKNLGLGESYMDGWWDCGQIDEMISRLLSSGIENKVKGGIKYLLHSLPGVLFNLQSLARSGIIAERHYNLGNDLFFSFLDEYKQYSCAFFDSTDDLEQAQQKKMSLLCRKLDLKEDDHLLDIGCGWGGLARYAAENFGCRVTAVNISANQLQHAREACRNLPVQFLECDYRKIQGSYDKIVSVGMFEHVGLKNYRTFMEVVSRCLKDNGIFVLHTIGNNTAGSNSDPWIEHYIFPNGMLPSLSQISEAAERYFVMEDVHNLGPHYDKTLMEWYGRFRTGWPELKNKYGERFRRMWEYYLLSCAGAFRARKIQLWQIVMTKLGCGTQQPLCRL